MTEHEIHILISEVTERDERIAELEAALHEVHGLVGADAGEDTVENVREWVIEYHRFAREVDELEAENATLSFRRCPICDLPLTSEDDTLAHLEDVHGLAPASHEVDRLRGENERLRAALEPFATHAITQADHYRRARAALGRE